MTKLKLFIVVALLAGAASAVPSAAARSGQSPAPDSVNPVVDGEVWAAATSDPDGMVALRVTTAPEEAATLKVALQALQDTGTLDTFRIAYGENAVYARGSRHAVRFLAAWSSVTRISLAGEDDLAVNDRLTIQTSEEVLATGGVAGTVTAADGTTPLPGIRVLAYLQTGPTSWVVVDTVLTASDGTYTVAGLEPGIYRAEFEDPAGDYVPEFYNDERRFAFAENLTVEDGETLTGIDAALAQAGHIAGTVTAVADGEPVADIVASAWYSTTAGWRSAGSAVTSDDGTYDIGGLPTGNYRVRFSDAYSPPRYLDKVYDNASSLADGTDVPVTAGATTTDIDAALGQYGSVSGTVYGPDGTTPVEGIRADVYDWNATGSVWEWVSGDTTDAAGAYQAGGLETGDYRIQFFDPAGQYATEVYDDKASLDTGDDVPVEQGEDTPNIDATLELAPEWKIFLPLILR